MAGLIWTVIVLLAILWVLGFAVNIGWWVHVLLVIALLGILFNLVITPLLAAQPHSHAHDHTDDTHLHGV